MGPHCWLITTWEHLYMCTPRPNVWNACEIIHVQWCFSSFQCSLERFRWPYLGSPVFIRMLIVYHRIASYPTQACWISIDYFNNFEIFTLNAVGQKKKGLGIDHNTCRQMCAVNYSVLALDVTFETLTGLRILIYDHNFTTAKRHSSKDWDRHSWSNRTVPCVPQWMRHASCNSPLFYVGYEIGIK